MKRYVAFLRAINVGGSKPIKMDALRKTFESFDLFNVETFIQSGNVIFETEAARSEEWLEEQLEKAMGYKVEIFLRSMAEIKKIVNQTRFIPKENETLHVVFLRKKPAKQLVESLNKYNSPADDFAVIGREVYNLRHDREKSVFSNNFIEKLFGVATTRNMTTIKKIFEKYQS